MSDSPSNEKFEKALGWGLNFAKSYLATNASTAPLLEQVENYCSQGPSIKDGDFDEKERKNEGNPIHWVNSIHAFNRVVTKFPIDEKNGLGQTPLHVHASHGRLDIVVHLLSNCVDVTVKDNIGNSALHFASKAGHLDIVKLLVIFGCRVDSKNISNWTPFDIAKNEDVEKCLVIGDGADNLKDQKRVSALKAKIEEELNKFESWRPTKDEPLVFENADKKNILLSLDGGGVRGLILVIMLMEIERITGKPIAELFKWIAGTSTGGILAIALANGKSLYHCMSLYLRLKDEVFPGKGLRPLLKLEKCLKAEFGEARLSDLEKRPEILVASTVCNQNPPYIHFFSNVLRKNKTTRHGKNSKGEPVEFAQLLTEDMFLWEAARNTALAPNVFMRSEQNCYLDGGVIANNPTQAAFTEIVDTWDGSDSQKICGIVSLGTGKQPVEKLDLHEAVGDGRASDIFGTMMNTVVQTAKLSIEQLTSSEGLPVESSWATCKLSKISFFRFSPQLAEFTDLDVTSNKIVTNFMWQTLAYLRVGRKAKDLEKLANFLK